MKNCPFCEAELDNGAHFCLRCMKGLGDKKQLAPLSYKKRLTVLTLSLLGVVLLIIAALGALSMAVYYGEKSGRGDGLPIDATVYTYRNATRGEVSSSSHPSDKCIVITGVKTATSDGIYDIPETIDGKTVIYIESFKFEKDKDAASVRSITLPKTVTALKSGAFANCLYIKIVYHHSDDLAVSPGAFPESLSVVLVRMSDGHSRVIGGEGEG